MAPSQDRHGLPAHALAYALELNWLVFPLVPGGKLPLISKARGGNGCHDASTDPDQIRAWWRRWPRANIGLACGTSFWALDIDTEAGLDLLAEHEDANRWPPVGPASRTGSGWQHQLYAPDPRLSNAVKPVPGLDTRSRGGYIVAPPSRHVSGGTYAWLPGREPWNLALPTAPECLIALVTKPKPAAEPAARTPRPPLSISIPYVEAAVRGELERVARAGEGQRNQTLFVAAAALGRFVAEGKLNDQAVRRALVDVAMAAGLPASEAARTTSSGITTAQRGAA